MRRSLPLVLALLCLPVTAVPAAADVVQNPAQDQAEAVLLRVMQAAVDGKVAAYLAEVHPDRRETGDQRTLLERYEWKRFKTQASWYVVPNKDPITVDVVRRAPQGENRVKLFIKDQKNTQRMPVPIEFTRKDGRWWVTANSL